MEERIGVETCNWFGDICSRPRVVARPRNVAELIAIIKDEAGHPAPVRAVGSNHSVTRCGVADGGTMVSMTAMDRIVHVAEDKVTTEAGILYIDVVNELRKRGLQFNVNLDIGNVTMGAAACAHTKDGSYPGEFGQLCSYLVAAKLVTPEGDRLEVTEEQEELLEAVRASFGLLGIVYEVTFRVEPLKPLSFHHESFTLDTFVDCLPELKARREAIAYYIFPFNDGVTVEFRHYHEMSAAGARRAWQLRNLAQRTGPGIARLVAQYVPGRRLRHFLLDGNLRLYQTLLNRLRSERSFAADQVIRYPERAGPGSFTFSLWAFPEDSFPEVLRAYFALCKEHDAEHGYRSGMPTLGYRVSQDTSSLLSYSYDGPMMTLDPASSGGPGWLEFLDAYNAFGSRHGGIPVFNQTPRLTREQVKRAYGERLEMFRSFRHRFDPQKRFLNDYFAEIL